MKFSTDLHHPCLSGDGWSRFAPSHIAWQPPAQNQDGRCLGDGSAGEKIRRVRACEGGGFSGTSSYGVQAVHRQGGWGKQQWRGYPVPWPTVEIPILQQDGVLIGPPALRSGGAPGKKGFGLRGSRQNYRGLRAPMFNLLIQGVALSGAVQLPEAQRDAHARDYSQQN